MDFVTLINILDNALKRDCIIFKSSSNMQKTVTYTSTSQFQAIINNNCNVSNINQIFFLEEDNNLIVYFEKLFENDVREYDTFNINEINSLEVVA